MTQKTVNIGGKDRPVEYNLNAIIDFDEATGIDLVNGFTPESISKPKTLRQFLFVGLKHGALKAKIEIDFTLENVGEWVMLDGQVFQDFLKVYIDQAKGSAKESADGGEATEKK